MTRRQLSLGFITAVLIALAALGSAAAGTPRALTGRAAFAAPTTPDLSIYGDALTGDWKNYSSVPINLATTSPVRQGTRSITFSPTAAYSYVSLWSNTGVARSQYLYFRFAIMATADNEQFQVFVKDGNGRMIGTPAPLAPINGVPPARDWREYELTLPQPSGAVVGNAALIKGVVIQSMTTTAQPLVYLDELAFTNATPPPPPSPSPSPTPPPNLPIYDNALAAGWLNWSWDSNVNLNFTTQAYTRPAAIQWSPTKGWAGLQFWNRSGVDTTPYQSLKFVMRATVNSQPFAVALEDGIGMLTDPIPLTDLGGAPSMGSWKVYTISLAALNGMNRTVNGVVFKSLSSSSQWPLYVDEVGFSNAAGFTPTATPTATPTLSVTPPAGPAAPTNLGTGTVANTSIELVWQDNATDETSYQIAYRPTAGSTWQFKNDAANTTRDTISGLAAGGSYYFYVRACNAIGCTWSNGIQATTTSGSVPPPPARPAAHGPVDQAEGGAVSVTATPPPTPVGPVPPPPTDAPPPPGVGRGRR